MRRRVATSRVAVLSIAILVALVALMISGVIAATARATETRHLISSADTQIVENAPTRNYGAVTSLGVSENDQSSIGKDKFALVKWDLSGIAPRTQINSASVTLSVTTASSQTYQAYVLKEPWVESAATWNVYSSGKPWEVAGAKGSLDKEAMVVGSITPSVKGKNTLTLPPGVVQDWVDHPATNQGIIIANPSSTRGFNFSSREDTDPTQRPQLTLNLSPDTTPPETTIDSGLSGTISSGDARFTFSSSEAGSTFECSLDGSAFELCSSPKEYTDLSEGSHTFSVKATDEAGNSDTSPASTTWTVDTIAPETTIDSGPSETITVAEATFEFSSEEGATFECRLDGEAYSACTSPKTMSYTNLSNGPHTFDVKATDGAGNVDATPASRTFSVEVAPPPQGTSPPETIIDSGPSGARSTRSARFAFSSSEAGSTFECSLDGSAFELCSSPKEYTDLSEGSHTFSVKATNEAGDAPPASRIWTVDMTSPETTIDSGPTDGATLSSGDASFTFSASEAGSTFECTLDGAAFASCTSPKDYTGLSESLHNFEVRATDEAGNVDPTPAVRHYSVEVPPPDTDSDLIPDSLDNCLTVANATQADADGDGTGDACDSQDNRDSDGDGVQNYQDQCAGFPDSADLDSDGIPDGCDADRDGDGRPNDTDYDPDDPNIQDTPATNRFPGIRFYKTVGIQEYDSTLMSATRVQNAYTTYMKSAYHGSDDSVDFVVQTSLAWEDLLDNENATPTLAQMRDPNWSGYAWDTPGTEASEVDAMLDAACVGQGKCKVAINLALGATGGSNPPQFMLDNGYAYVGAGAAEKNVRVKWYNTAARQYAENFVHALLQHWNDPNVASIRFDEYFPGGTKPGDFNQDAYEDGYLTFMENVIADAPTDGNGDRVAIYQTNPMTNSDAFTAMQIKNMMLGIADSNAQMFEEPAGQVSLRSSLRSGGVNVVPMSVGTDAPSFRDSTTYTAAWDGPDNPFGFSGAHTITLSQVLWYYGNCGPDPMDQRLVTKPGAATDQFMTAMDQFGPGGSDQSENCSPSTDDWGGVPFGD